MSQTTGNLFKLEAQPLQKPTYVHPSTGMTEVKGIFKLVADPQGPIYRLEGTTVFVIDKSGSMDYADKIKAAKEAVILSLELTKDGDRAGVIVFDSPRSHRWLVPMTVMNDKTRKEAINLVKSLRAGGGTCFSEPISTAVDALLNDKSEVRKLVFLTDGMSESFANDDTMAISTAEKLNGVASIDLYGIGLDYDPQFMDAFVAATGASFYHVPTSGQGIDHLMGGNAARIARAIAAGVGVKIEPVDVKFKKNPDGSLAPVHRHNPVLTELYPIADGKMFKDPNVGVVNEVEGVTYSFSLAGKVDVPAGQTNWDAVVAVMTVNYTVDHQDYVQVIELVQSFTTDISQAVFDKSVAQTMAQTDMTAQAMSIMATMAKTGDPAAASVALTMVQEKAAKAGLTGLAVTLGEMAEGIEAGDEDSVRAQHTRLGQSGAFDQLLGGMEEGE